ncbi:hypothetical protein BDZ97DRAFT_1820591 [Flammula alnicola]|nr:hypothetical protein BDZ97DRAFT_1820591 [Flammula alnicola]
MKVMSVPCSFPTALHALWHAAYNRHRFFNVGRDRDSPLRQGEEARECVLWRWKCRTEEIIEVTWKLEHMACKTWHISSRLGLMISRSLREISTAKNIAHKFQHKHLDRHLDIALKESPCNSFERTAQMIPIDQRSLFVTAREKLGLESFCGGGDGTTLMVRGT